MHVFARELTQVARKVERAFFRIEKESRILAGLVTGLIAGLAVGLVAWMFSEGDLLLFACLGSSASSVVFAPIAKNNSLRSIVMAYLLAATVSLTLYPIHRFGAAPLAVQCLLAVGGSVALMRWFDAMHPAAVGSALAFIVFDREIKSLMLLLFAILVLLTVVKALAYIYLEELAFRDFGREFRAAYYGREMTVTLELPDATETQAKAPANEAPAE